MRDDAFPVEMLRRELVAAFEAVAVAESAPDGRVLLGQVSLRALMDDALEEQMSVSEFLLAIADGEPEVLVHHAVRNPAPPDWDWSLDGFRIDDRGYIALILEEDEEPEQPVLGAWEPFASQAAFEACFVEVYRQHLDQILFGTHLWLGPRVGRELFASALWAGMEAGDGDTFRWEQLRDYAFPLDAVAGRRAVLDHYVQRVPEP